MTSARRTAVAGAGLALGAALLLTACAPATAPPAAASPPDVRTVEERRLDGPVPREILERSGLADLPTALDAALDRAASPEDAERAVAEAGRSAWRRAVDRVQGRVVTGDLPADDDRPLYWARLGMAAALRAWQPAGFALDDARRSGLVTTLESTSRGQDTVATTEPGVRTVLVTGFDPFTLDRDIRRSNPSGAVALALDGTEADTAAGRVRIEAVTFPVRWTDFADGAVERVLEGVLPRVAAFTTISQGSPGRFDLERTNGAWRGGTPDNENLSRTGPVPVADPGSAPQWTTTTLASALLASRPSGRFPVVDHTEVTEIPAGGGPEVERPDGPTPGSAARAGGGGDYLSNEIAYRATLVRDRLGLRDRLPGGHVHTPVLDFGPGNTDPASGTAVDDGFVRNRLDITAQARAIVLSATEVTMRR